MVRHGRKGVLGMLRGDGSLVRALILALALQVVVPLLGILPAAKAALPDGAITVCTVQGIVTLVPDGQGGWTRLAEPESAGLSCTFCLPLMSGHAGPVADLAEPLPPPVPEAAAPSLVADTPQAALPPGSFSPRAPPVLR